jgi:hypothetical protein
MNYEEFEQKIVKPLDVALADTDCFVIQIESVPSHIERKDGANEWDLDLDGTPDAKLSDLIAGILARQDFPDVAVAFGPVQVDGSEYTFCLVDLTRPRRDERRDGASEVSYWLELDDGSFLENPDQKTVADALSAMDWEVDRYAILSKTEMTYMQTSGNASSGLIVEYQAGSKDEHYRATRDDISLEEVITAFQDYLQGAEQWKSRFEWIQI